MIEIFRHKDYSIVGFYRTILEEVGIRCLIRNEALCSTEGAVIPDFYPALCVAHDEDAERATSILREYLNGAADSSEEAPEWTCPSCGEAVPGSFGSCWQCEAQQPG